LSEEAFTEGIKKYDDEAAEFINRPGTIKALKDALTAKDTFDKENKESLERIQKELKENKITKDQADKLEKAINTRKFTLTFEGVFNAEMNDYRDRKELLKKITLTKNAINNAIQGNLKDKYSTEATKDPEKIKSNISSSRLKKNMQALLYINEILDDFDKLTADEISARYSYEACEAGTKKNEGKITDKLIAEMKKNIGEKAIADGNDKKIFDEVNAQLNKISGKDKVKTDISASI